MLNDEDVKYLNRLLDLVKSSSDLDSCDFHYSKEHGWRVGAYPTVLELNDDYGGYEYKKERLGKLCLDKIAYLVQKKLGG